MTMRMGWAAWLLIACGSVGSDIGGGTGGGTGDGTTASGSMGAGTTGHASGSASTAATTGTSGTGGVSSVCEPQPEYEFSFEFDGTPSWGFHYGDVDLDESCTVKSSQPLPGGWLVELGCTGQDAPSHDHTLEVTAELGEPPQIAISGDVDLRVFAHACIDCPSTLYVSLRNPGGELLFAWRSAGFGMPPFPVDLDAFFGPLTFEPILDACEDEPHDSEPCGVFICFCRTIDRRLASWVSDGSEQVEIMDGHQASLGPLWIQTRTTRREQIPEFCEGAANVGLHLQALVWRAR